MRLATIQYRFLTAEQESLSTASGRIASIAFQNRPRADHETTELLKQAMGLLEVEVAVIYDAIGNHLWRKQFAHVDILRRAIKYVKETQSTAPRVKPGVNSDISLLRYRAVTRQIQINRCRIERVDHLGQLNANDVQ